MLEDVFFPFIKPSPPPPPHPNVECYDVDTDLWKLVSPLVEHSSGAGAASLNGFVYAIDGYDGETQFNSVERYSPASDYG